MKSLKAILFCIIAAVAYGILHDQVTARVCIERFHIYLIAMSSMILIPPQARLYQPSLLSYRPRKGSAFCVLGRACNRHCATPFIRVAFLGSCCVAEAIADT
jgi:hypothetical protein